VASAARSLALFFDQRELQRVALKPKMIDSRSDCRKAEGARWMQVGILAAACVLVIGVYAYTAQSGYVVSSSPNAADSYYNLLVQGFRAGQLSLKKEVPSGLEQLADPYDPAANSHYDVLDTSYYKGKLFLYFGVTPAVVLLWPYVALTSHYLPQKDAAVIFCFVGFLTSVGLLCALWRRYFTEVSMAVVAAGTLALGLATGVPVMLARCDVYEVSISCGYALTMVALAAIWKALHEPERRCWWLAAASVAYGLAVGARPSLLFGAVILLAPVVQAWRERRPIGGVLAAAVGPIGLVSVGLMLYNFLRFDSPFEFGLRYQLSGIRQDTAQRFHLRYLWYNLRVYFLEPARWGGRFPFVRDITVPPLPAGHVPGVQQASSILIDIPLVWLALAAPLAWRGRSAEARSVLGRFLAAVAMFSGICALTIALFCTTAQRYEVEFLPALVVLAVIGLLSLERTLAWQPRGRMSGGAIRLGWSCLLGFSVAFNLLTTVVWCAEAHNNLGLTQQAAGQMQEAMAQFSQALRLKPDFALAHYNLGIVLEQVGRVQEAIGHYEQAVRSEPDFGLAHYELGIALVKQGRLQEATEHWKHALRIQPGYADAHNTLGIALVQLGRPQEAIYHWEQALRINPDLAEVHYNLGVTLEQVGRVQEAIQHYEQALRIQPDFVQAQNALARARAVQ